MMASPTNKMRQNNSIDSKIPHGNSYRTWYELGVVISLDADNDDGVSKNDNINMTNILKLRMLVEFIFESLQFKIFNFINLNSFFFTFELNLNSKSGRQWVANVRFCDESSEN